MNSITFNMRSLNGLDTPNIRFFFQGQTTVAQYGDNEFSVQDDSSLTNWTFNLTHNATGGTLQVGDKIEFEFSPFMLTVSNGQLNYYGGAILYVAGQGIVPWQAPESRSCWGGGCTKRTFWTARTPSPVIRSTPSRSANSDPSSAMSVA